MQAINALKSGGGGGGGGGGSSYPSDNSILSVGSCPNNNYQNAKWGIA